MELSQMMDEYLPVKRTWAGRVGGGGGTAPRPRYAKPPFPTPGAPPIQIPPPHSKKSSPPIIVGDKNVVGASGLGRISEVPDNSSLVATAFWQVAIRSPAFRKRLSTVKASQGAANSAERFVIPHGGPIPRYDLIIFDPMHRKTEPVTATLEMNANDLRQGFRRLRATNPAALRQHSWIQDAAISASLSQEFGVMIVAPPPIQRTWCPTPPWCVESQSGSGWLACSQSTAGVVARNQNNVIGVTAALHALNGFKTAVIKGQTCKVVSEDPISDSCFIEVPKCQIPKMIGTAGPLRGVTPRQYAPVSFEGATSVLKHTIVTGWSPDLPNVLPYSQLKVLTKPDTNPGDSGAALIDQDDHILGFSFYRTGFGALIEFATWIWADSVFQAHGLAHI